MNAPIHSVGIGRALLDACERFAGAVDHASARNHVLTMFFLKYVSDRWHDQHERYQAQFGANPRIVAELLRHERFALPPDARFPALYARRHEDGNAARVEGALTALANANAGKLRSVFRAISLGAANPAAEAAREAALRLLLDDLAAPELDLRQCRFAGSDACGQAYELLLARAVPGVGQEAGALYSPPGLARLMALLLAPRAGDAICDPVCGAGTLLTSCARLIRAQSGASGHALYGQETGRLGWALAKLNLYLHGEENHHVELGDVFRDPHLVASDGRLMQFDIVLSTPSLALGNWERWQRDAARDDKFKRFHRGVPPLNRADYALISHMVEALKPVTGRMAILVPHGVLFRAAAEGAIRRRLIQENLLDAVIGLPEKLLPGISIPFALLVFRRQKPDRDILFIDASRECEEGKFQNMLREPDVQRILAAFCGRVAIAAYAHLAAPAEVAANDYNLSIGRYVNSYAGQRKINLPSLYSERQALKAELAALESQLDAALRHLGHAD